MLKVVKISSDMAQEVLGMQKSAFMPLLEKYQDYNISPAMENKETIIEKINRTNTDTYLFVYDKTNVGCVRIANIEERVYKISNLCIMPEFQNKGIAQLAISQIESLYPQAKKWCLATIMEEVGNCHLYEKIGYIRTQESHIINETMTIIGYEKFVK